MSSWTATSGSIALLNYFQINIHKIGDSILVVLGTLSCLFSLIIFARKELRKSPCAIYFLAYNIANLLYIYFVIFITLLQWGYSIDPGAYNLTYCRFRFYLYYLFGSLSPYYLLLASIDRILITSKTNRLRQWSTRRIAYLLISLMTLFWMIVHIHTLFYMNIYRITAYYISCTYDPGVYTIFVNYYQLLIRGIFTTLLMIIFLLFTVKNIRRAHRLVPVSVSRITNGNNYQHLTQKDRQFILMLFIDIIIYVICSIPRPIYMIFIEATKDQVKDAEQQALESFFNSLTLFITFIPTCTGFYTNFIISKTFRQHVQKLFTKTLHFCCFLFIK